MLSTVDSLPFSMAVSMQRAYAGHPTSALPTRFPATVWEPRGRWYGRKWRLPLEQGPAGRLDPLWSDDWQPWNNHGWAIPKVEFDAWLLSPDALAESGLPPSPPITAASEVILIERRQPAERDRVSLSEAVSWIAFDLALGAE